MLVFTFGALLNAFGMVSPIYALESWLGARMGTAHEAPVLGTVFLLLLVVEPLLLLGLAAWLTRRAAGTREPLLPLATRFAYALVPLGSGIWMAHYSFHLFTGLFTFIPVTQSALADAGLPLLGPPLWSLRGIPPGFIHPLELGFLALGLLGSLLVAWRIAEREVPDRSGRAPSSPGPGSASCSGLPRSGFSRSRWTCAAWRADNGGDGRNRSGGLSSSPSCSVPCRSTVTRDPPSRSWSTSGSAPTSPRSGPIRTSGRAPSS